MGIDRGLVRAFGFFSCGVVALSAAGAAAVALATGQSDVVQLFVPMLVAYGAIVIAPWLGLVLYCRVRSRLQPPG